MVETRACVRCGKAHDVPATGRPPTYCPDGCRRAAKHEERRLDRRLERLEDELTRLPPSLHKQMGRPYHGRTLEEHRGHLQDLHQPHLTKFATAREGLALGHRVERL